LTRRPNEVICIGPDIQVRVLGIKGIQVRLAVSAPKEVSVDRAEVRARKEAEVKP
jgi:carbon storage regulator